MLDFAGGKRDLVHLMGSTPTSAPLAPRSLGGYSKNVSSSALLSSHTIQSQMAFSKVRTPPTTSFEASYDVHMLGANCYLQSLTYEETEYVTFFCIFLVNY